MRTTGIRFLTGFCLVAVMAPVILFAPNWGSSILFGILAGIAAFEIAGCAGHRDEWWVTALTVLLCAAGAAIHGGMTGEAAGERPPVFEILFAAVLLLLTLLYGLVTVVRHATFPADSVLVQFGLSVYVLLGFSSLCRLSDTPHRILLVVAIAVPWVADSLAYFGGRAFGKRKLCPTISPKKTVEGAVAGVLGTSLIAAVLYGCLKGNWSPLALAVIFVSTAILSVFSIFGDLFASVVKRRYGLKDYGKLLPGHGGIMDRFDSVLPVSMVLFLLSRIPYFTELMQ